MEKLAVSSLLSTLHSSHQTDLNFSDGEQELQLGRIDAMDPASQGNVWLLA